MTLAGGFVGLHHAGLKVRNLAAAQRFFEQAVGLHAHHTVTAVTAVTAVGAVAAAPWQQGVLMQGPNAAITLKAVTGATPEQLRPVSRAGITHVCLQSTAMADLHQAFAAAGASFHGEPVDLGTGFLYCYARDPEGNVIELEGFAPVWPDPKPWLAHVSITTADLTRLRDFYSLLLGSAAHTSTRLGPRRRMDIISGLQGTQLQAAWLAAGNQQLELIQYFNPATRHEPVPDAEDTPGWGHLAFEVSDLPTAKAHALACGAQPLREDNDVHSAWLRDPDGNRLLLLQITPAQASLAIQAQSQPHIVAQAATLRTQAAP